MTTDSLAVERHGLADITGAVNSDITTVAGDMRLSGNLTTDSLAVERHGFADITGAVNSGATTVAGGMRLNGVLATNSLTIASSGLLSGAGRINGNLFNYGTFKPGNSVGSLTVNGALSFMPGSVYAVELEADGDSDRLNVSGPVYLHGGTVQTALPRSLYNDGQSWTIIAAGHGINGTFSSLVDDLNSPTLDLFLSYDANQVLLEIDRTSFASFGLTPNEKGVGAGLDNVIPLADGSLAALITSMDFDMNGGQIQNILHALNPEIYTTFGTTGVQGMNVLDQVTATHQAELRQDRKMGLAAGLTPTSAEDDKHWDLWAKALGNWSEQDSENGFLGYNQDLTGMISGLDGIFSERLRAGLNFGYSDSTLQWEGTGHRGDMQGVHLGAYASADVNDFFVDASSSYASFDNNVSRNINFNEFSARAGSDFDASAWLGRLEGGYDFELNNWLLSPLASLNYTRLEQDGFSERGADFLNLHINESATDSCTSTLGVRFSGLIKNEQWQFIPRTELRWLHQFQDEGSAITASFVDYSASSFSVTGIGPAADQGLMSLGLTTQYGQNIALFVDGFLALADGYDANMISGGLSWRF